MKVLIGITAGKEQKHCHDRFISAINSQGPHDKIVAVLDAETTKAYSSFKVLQALDVNDAREKLRDYALKNKYDALFLVDANIIIPEGCLSSLMSVKVPIVGAPYLNQMSVREFARITPVVYAFGVEEGSAFPVPVEMLIPREVMQAAAVGFGACLIHRNALETGKLDDCVEFCLNAKKKGLLTGADTRVKCVHVEKDREYDWPVGMVNQNHSIDAKELGLE